MVHIFLSDVHLGAFSTEINQKLERELINLVDYCQSNQIRIHILGDLFDYWMEFPDYLPNIGRNVLDRFEEYNRVMNFNTTYITGNHDYWTVSHFHDRGFLVEHEYAELSLDSFHFFLCHGDGLSDPKFQLPRPILHRFIRTPKFVTFYKTLLGGKKGVELMKRFSAFSRDEENLDTERLNKWAENMLDNNVYNAIITGHDHVARIETFSGGRYINTGAFYKQRTVLKYTKGNFRLVRWVDGKNKFEPF